MAGLLRATRIRDHYRVEDEAGQPVKAKIVPTRRDDVSQIYYKKIIDRDLGFDIRFPYEHGKNYYLVICGGKKTTRVKYSDMTIRRKTGAANRKVQKLMNLMNMETVHVAMDFWKEHGLKAWYSNQSTSFRELTMTMITASGMTLSDPRMRNWQRSARRYLILNPCCPW